MQGNSIRRVGLTLSSLFFFIILTEYESVSACVFVLVAVLLSSYAFEYAVLRPSLIQLQLSPKKFNLFFLVWTLIFAGLLLFSLWNIPDLRAAVSNKTDSQFNEFMDTQFNEFVKQTTLWICLFTTFSGAYVAGLCAWHASSEGKTS